MLLSLALILIGILITSLILQEKMKVPFPITMIVSVFGLAAFNIEVIKIDDDTFDQLLLMILPTLLVVDVLHLKPSELKGNWRSILATAGFGVAVAISTGLFLQEWILPGYEIETAAMIALMTMVTATDPVTVAAIFANYKMPGRLKFLVESESLHNDGTAFIIFSSAIAFMATPMGPEAILANGALTLGGAVIFGLIGGVIGTYLLRMSNDPMTEAFIILGVVSGAFWAAEQFHFAGIFAVVVSAIFMNVMVHIKGEKALKQVVAAEKKTQEKPNKANILALEHLVHTYQNHKQIVHFISFVALIANTILFVSMADLIDFKLLEKYWVEIVSIFIATTLIRGGVMAGFALTSNQLKIMQNINFDWWAVMTSAGVKGGLSILMLHMFPSDYEHYELFEAIVIGNILLSTFVYSIVLTLVITFRQKALTESEKLVKN